jgi:2-amino-4-hydroxy-6-hydroxymethyldihydropteridine diphosphokinase
MKVVIALGSNLGDREEILNRAVKSLSNFLTNVRISSFYETDPVGGPDQPDYLNAVMTAEYSLAPELLLKQMQEIENEAGRTREVRWGARTLDLDLIAVDAIEQEDDFLTLPHPRAHERAFVLEPWLEIDADAQIPGKGSAQSLLANLRKQG